MELVKCIGEDFSIKPTWPAAFMVILSIENMKSFTGYGARLLCARWVLHSFSSWGECRSIWMTTNKKCMWMIRFNVKNKCGTIQFRKTAKCTHAWWRRIIFTSATGMIWQLHLTQFAFNFFGLIFNVFFLTLCNLDKRPRMCSKRKLLDISTAITQRGYQKNNEYIYWKQNIVQQIAHKRLMDFSF